LIDEITHPMQKFQSFCFICNITPFFLKTRGGLHEKFQKKLAGTVVSLKNRGYCIINDSSAKTMKYGGIR